MRRIERSALLSFSAAQMFDVVYDVTAYREFLPWCDESDVLELNESDMLARLSIAKSGLRQQFTTRNRFSRSERLDMELVEGPFDVLLGQWRFQPLGGDGCKVELDLKFDFNSNLANLALGKVFEHAADTLVDAFCARADVLYG